MGEGSGRGRRRGAFGGVTTTFFLGSGLVCERGKSAMKTFFLGSGLVSERGKSYLFKAET